MNPDELRAQAMIHWEEQVYHLTEYLRLVRAADAMEMSAMDAAQARREMRRLREFAGPTLRANA